MALDREAIRRRCEAATPGPWWFPTDVSVFMPRILGPQGWNTLVCTFKLLSNDADGEFIAHARDDIPALLARLNDADALRAALNDVRRQWAAGMGDARVALDAAIAAYDGEREGCDE